MNKFSKIHLFVLAAILCTVAVDLSGVLTKLDLNISKTTYSNNGEVVTSKLNLNTEPATLNSDKKESIDIKFTPNGFHMSSILKIDFEGSTPIFKNKDTQKPLECLTELKDGECRVKVSLSPTDESNFLLYSTNGQAIINGIDIQTYKAKRATTFSGNIIFAFFLFLAISGFLVTKLKENSAKLALTVFTLSVLFILSYKVALFTLSFLLLSYILIKTIYNSNKAANKPYFRILFLFVILALLLVKIVIPYTSQYFLNPGGLFLAIPLGFSYFIIKIIDLGVDSYRGSVKDLSFSDFLSYMLFPATVAAGPIKTYKQFQSSRIENYSVVDYSAGIARVFIGITKKLFADALLFPVVSSQIDVFVNSPTEATNLLVFQLLIFNFLYIYLDFSAYCDMAIGSARAMGYKVPENFSWPILRTSVSQYWQHWHITLSSWVRRNVFMNVMLSTRSLFFSTFSTMLVIGLWHKLSLGWLSWALHHTVIMRTEDYFKRSFLTKKSRYIPKRLYIPNIFKISYVWFMVAAGQSFIIFSDYTLSIIAYVSMLTAIPTWILSLF